MDAKGTSGGSEGVGGGMNNSVRYWTMIAVLLAGTAGMGFLNHGESTPPARPMSDFPKDVGNYRTVADIPFDQATLDVLGVTDYLNRIYFSPQEGEVGLYVGYFRTQRTGAQIHSPKNCLPGAGWQPVVSQTYQLALDDGRKVPINLYVIRKDLDQEIVLYWYQSHGRVVASEYWGKFYMVYDAMRLNRTDAALVRITAPVRNGDTDAAREQALAFAKQVSSDVDQVIPR
jgi:EpsI family protein